MQLIKLDLCMALLSNLMSFCISKHYPCIISKSAVFRVHSYLKYNHWLKAIIGSQKLRLLGCMHRSDGVWKYIEGCLSREITVIGELPSQIHKPPVVENVPATDETRVRFSDGAPSVGFWHVQSAKSMHQGTSNCGTVTAVHFARALGNCMMLLPPIHAPQSPHAFCRLRPSPGSCNMRKRRGALAQPQERLNPGTQGGFNRELN